MDQLCLVLHLALFLCDQLTTAGPGRFLELISNGKWPLWYPVLFMA